MGDNMGVFSPIFDRGADGNAIGMAVYEEGNDEGEDDDLAQLREE